MGVTFDQLSRPRRLARLGLSWPVAAKAFIAALFVLACAESSSLGIRPWIHASRPATVVLTADGRILLDGIPVSIEELSEQLEAAKAADPSFRARLAGEAGMPPSLARSVAELCFSLGIVEGPSTKPPEP